MITALIYFAAFGIFGGVLYLAYRHGQEMERSVGIKNDMEAAHEAKQVENDIRRMSDNDVSERLRKWQR